MTEIKMTQKEYDRRIDAIKVCGANRGPHKYIPVSWKKLPATEDQPEAKLVSQLLCTICFTRVSMSTVAKHFHEATV